jgi:hypothetical protein
MDLCYAIDGQRYRTSAQEYRDSFSAMGDVRRSPTSLMVVARSLVFDMLLS